MEVASPTETNEENLIPQPAIDWTFSVELEGSHVLFGEKVSTLQKLASFRVALSLWYNFLSEGESKTGAEDVLGDNNKRTCRTEGFYVRYFKRVEKYLDSLPSIPHIIREMIRESLVKIQAEVISWNSDYSSSFSNLSDGIITRSRLKCCIWSLKGRIHHEKTAKQILSTLSLSETKKFQIMCKYCLETEIRNLSPDADLENYMNEINFVDDPVIFYWICVLNNDLEKIPVLPDSGSIERFMITKIREEMQSLEMNCSFDQFDNCSYAYFWNHMSERDQLLEAVEALKNCWGDRLMFILRELNELQQRYVFFHRPADVVAYLFRNSEPEKAFLVWMRVKNLINCEQFSKLLICSFFSLRNICPNIDDYALYPLYYDFIDDSNVEFGGSNVEFGGSNVMPWLIQLWNMADDRLKNYFLNRQKHVIVECYFRRPKIRLIPLCVEFLSALLSHSSNYAKDIMLEYGDILIAKVDFSLVVDIIQICKLNTEELAQFKKLLMESSIAGDHCASLFKNIDGTCS